MTLLHWLALGVFLTLPVNWLAFAVVAIVERRHPEVKSLTDRRWISLGIAVLSTTLSLLGTAFLLQFRFGADGTALLLVVPVYALTLVNAVFLWLTWKGRW